MGNNEANRIGSIPIFVTVIIAVVLQITAIVMVANIKSEVDKINKDMNTNMGSDNSCSNIATLEITSSVYGTLSNGTEITKYTIKNSKGMSLSVLTLGAMMRELWVPDKNGEFADILLDYKDLSVTEEKMKDTSSYPFFGAIIGRYANRISECSFELDGQVYQLPDNNNGNTLHGGPDNWSKRVWTAHVGKDHVRFDLDSPDGDQGFPGNVKISVLYSLTDDNGLVLNYSASVYGNATPINPTSHGYFNLAGQGSGTIYNQEVTVFCDEYVTTDPSLIPYGNLSSVSGTGYDLRNQTRWGDAIPKVVNNQNVTGFDLCYKAKGTGGLRYAARIVDPSSGRVMKVYTDQIGVQVYTANYLNVPNGEGKGGNAYPQHSAFCFEAQDFPDAINQPSFPDSVLRPGSEYKQNTIYQFSTL